jgi:hypothetical protein
MNTITTTARIQTPTWGFIEAGTVVTVVERMPGMFHICEGRRKTALMTADDVAAVTVVA